MRRIPFVFCVLIILNTYGQKTASENITKPLFNGKNLDGWYSFLTSKGKNNDPEKVYRNFHLIVEFKWGIKKYPPRDADTTKRDNGILYYVPLDAKDFVWPKGIECQIQEGDVGDFWMVDSATIVTDGQRSVPKDFTRVAKKKDAEKKSGEWNIVEVIAVNGKIKHIVNGVLVNECEAASLNEGKIIIQSEGAEIWFKKIAIAEL